jgi:outer membrane protein assembly factor BamB
MRWRVAAGRGPIASSPAVADGVVCFGDARALHAVELESHRKRWTFDHRPTVDSPATIVDAVVCFGAGSTLYALDTQSGEVDRQFKLSDEELAFLSPAVVDEVVCGGADDGHPCAVPVERGRCAW